MEKQITPIWDPYSEFRSVILENGLTIHSLQVKRPWQRMGFMVHSGALIDSFGKEGTGHFVEHLISENGSISAKTLVNYFKKNGGRIMQGSTDFWRTRYDFFIPLDKRIFAKSMSYFGKMLLDTKLDKKIERERSVIINEFSKKYPLSFIYDRLLKINQILYEGYPLERMTSALGTPSSIQRITQEDLQRYYDQYYTPANISIVAVGGYSLEQLIDGISAGPFYNNKAGARITYQTLKSFPKLSENRYELSLSDHLKSESAKNAVYESYARIPLSFGYVALSIFCGMLTELLISELREKHAWTYGVRAYWNSMKEFSKFVIECPSFSIGGIETIEAKIDLAILSIFNNEKLFNKIKKEKLAYVYMNDENFFTILQDSMDEIWAHGKIITLAESEQNIRNVSFENVCELIPHVTAENRLTLIVKP